MTTMDDIIYGRTSIPKPPGSSPTGEWLRMNYLMRMQEQIGTKEMGMLGTGTGGFIPGTTVTGTPFASSAEQRYWVQYGPAAWEAKYRLPTPTTVSSAPKYVSPVASRTTTRTVSAAPKTVSPVASKVSQPPVPKAITVSAPTSAPVPPKAISAVGRSQAPSVTRAAPGLPLFGGESKFNRPQGGRTVLDDLLAGRSMSSGTRQLVSTRATTMSEKARPAIPTSSDIRKRRVNSEEELKSFFGFKGGKKTSKDNLF